MVNFGRDRLDARGQSSECHASSCQTLLFRIKGNCFVSNFIARQHYINLIGDMSDYSSGEAGFSPSNLSISLGASKIFLINWMWRAPFSSGKRCFNRFAEY